MEGIRLKKTKMFLGAGLGLLLVGSVFATGNHPMAGCGLAYMLFAQENSQGTQILASTTNNSYGTQSFGITSGTSGCTNDGLVRLDRERLMFAEANFKTLTRQMAAGNGEFVATFGSLMGCGESAIPTFVQFTQDNYETLIPSVETTPLELLETIESQIQAHPTLAQSCTL